MNNMFNKFVKFYTKNTMFSSYRVDSFPVGLGFNGWYAKNETTLLKNVELCHHVLTDQGDYPDYLLEESFFNFGYCSNKISCFIFWSFMIACQKYVDTSGRYNRDENSQNSEFISTLSNVMDFLSFLDESITSDGGYYLYYADASSDRSESKIGADYCVIMPVGEGLFKVALFQAKKVKNEGEEYMVDVSRKSPSSCAEGYQQLTRLLNIL